MPVTKFETGRYIIDVDVDPDFGTQFGDIDERVLYCKDCGNAWDDEDGNMRCREWDGQIVEMYEWCSRRVRRHDE